MKNPFKFIVPFILVSFAYSFGNTPFFISIGDTTKKESPVSIKSAKNNCYLISGTVGNKDTLSYEFNMRKNAFAMKIDKTGRTIWHTVLANDTFNRAVGIVETDSNSYLVFGSSRHYIEVRKCPLCDLSTAPVYYAWVTLLDSSGEIVWTKKLMDMAEAKVILKKNDGNLLVAADETVDSAPYFGIRGRILTLTQEGQIVSSSVFDLGTKINDICQLSNDEVYFTGAARCNSWYGDEWLGNLNGLDTINRGYRGTAGIDVGPTNDQSYFWIAYGWYTNPINTGVKIRTNWKEASFDLTQPPYRVEFSTFSPFRGFHLPNNSFSIICKDDKFNAIGMFLLDSQLVPISFKTVDNINFDMRDAVKNSDNNFACVGVSSLDSTMKFGIIIPDTNANETKIRNVEIRNVEGHNLDQIGSFDILGRKFYKNKNTSMQLYISKLNNIYNKKLAGKTALK